MAEQISTNTVLLQSIVDSVADSVFLVDIHTLCYTFANRRMRHLCGISETEFAPKTIVGHWPEINLETFNGVLALLLNQQQDSFVIKTWALYREGCLRQIELTIRILPAGTTTQPFVLCVERDITDRIALEKRRDDIVSALGHELRTPLTSVIGSLGLLIGGVVGEIEDRPKLLINLALQNSQRMLHSVNDMLGTAGSGGETELFFDVTDISGLVTKAVLSNSGMAQEKEVRLVLSALSKEVFASVDVHRMTQVMDGLIAYAVGHSGQGGNVDVSVRTDGDVVRIVIREDSTRIRDNTDQVSFNSKGLAYSKGMIEKMGGRLSFSPRKANGTAVIVDLPLFPTFGTDTQPAPGRH